MPHGNLSYPSPSPFKLSGKADALFGGLEDDERRGLGGAELTQELVVHHDFGNAAIGRQRTNPARPTSDVVELQAEAGGSSTPSGATTRISLLF